MGCMLRSDLMSLYDIYLQPEAAFDILTHLGNMSCVQFLDMNPETQVYLRSYISDICRCAEMERKLRYMDEEMNKDHIPKAPLKIEPIPLQPKDMLPLENILEKWNRELNEMSAHYGGLMKLYTDMSEMYYVLENIGPMLGDAEIRNALLPPQFMKESDILADLNRALGGQLMVLTGVIKLVRSFPFQTMLWRLTHGNIYYRQATEDRVFTDASGQRERKVAFLVICQGDELHARLLKVCTGFRVNLYPCPRTHDDRMKMTGDLATKLYDQEKVLERTKYMRCKALFAVSQQWTVWKTSVKKAKAIYHNLNTFNFDVTKKCLIGRCWIPDADVARVKDTLKYHSEQLGTTVESFLIKSEQQSDPPTYHRTNKFTNGFQALINAYGESRYRELNPGLYTIITFPFLFAVMFGDLGHGIILVIFAMWMILKEKKIIAMRSTNEIFNIAFGGRYVILMLGLFSIATGFVYNDIFSVAFRLTGSSFWTNIFSKDDLSKHHQVQLDPRLNPKARVYFFGMDPIWRVALNKIVVENSFKMKMSIILGVIHMTFGLILAFWNDIFFRKRYHIFLVDIPQVLVLAGLFIWLVILMYAKWFMYQPKHAEVDRTPGCAPLLLILLIELVLAGQTTTKPPEGCSSAFLFGDVQQTIHRVLLLIVIISIPVMLFGAPLFLWYQNRKEMKNKKEYLFRKYQRKNTAERVEEAQKLAAEQKSQFDFPDIMIKQAIHTIEYTLSTISHTASYLRLWALSLAHAQLSEMLWAMIFRDIGLRACIYKGKIIGAIFLFIIFAVWASFTLAILVVMEGMSAFLHTLRLHWVEFMSKFFTGGGWFFQPFSFDQILFEDDKPEGFCKRAAEAKNE